MNIPSFLKKHLKPVIFLSLLLSLLCFAAFFYSRRSVPHDAGSLFSEFKREILSESAENAGIALHYMLEHPEAYDLSPSDSFSHYEESSYLASASDSGQKLSKLKEINASELSRDDRILYDIIKWNLEKESELSDYLYYDDCFSVQSGVQNQLLTLFAEYEFRNKTDAETYLSLLSDLPEYIESLKDYETRRAEQGLIFRPEQLTAVSEQCSDFSVLFSTDDNFLAVTFHNRLSGSGLFTEDECQKLETENLRILTEELSPCYRELALYFDELYETIQAGNTLTALYPAYYEACAQYSIGTDRSIPELFLMGKTRLSQDLSCLYALLSSDPELFSALSNASFPESEPGRILSWLSGHMDEQFPDLPDMEYEIKDVDDALSPFTAPAFYLIPAIDSRSSHTIYLNRGQGGLSQPSRLFSTLAHEGYPGHLYQNAYFLSTDPDICRRLYFSAGYAEGWATYAELYSYRLADLPKNTANAFIYDASFSLGIYALCDIGVNYYSWTQDETQEFLTKYGLSGIDAGKITEAVTREPGSYLPYYFGLLELEDLKKELHSQMGNDYSELAFHTFYLEFGPAPFSVMKEWLYADSND